LNPRLVYGAPKVIFFHNAANLNEALPAAYPPTLSRMWVLYRKGDPNGTVRSGIYYKAMRLMVHLPRPVLLRPDQSGNPQPQISVAGNLGPVEVDWVRGRLYFTEVDEGNQVTVSYMYQGPNSPLNSGSLTYRVSWGDE